MSDLKVGVVIPAAGRGTRLGGPVPKQYHKILVSLPHFYGNIITSKNVLFIINVSQFKLDGGFNKLFL